jgi:hypothetical protein
MREVRRAGGSIQKRPFYSDKELERICLEALLDADLLPVTPSPVRVDRFVEKHFGCTPEYEPLPPGVLGFTEFSRQGVARIVVSNELDDATVVSRRRERSTLAHEAGHGLYHGHLFIVEEHPSLLPRERELPTIMCREVADVAVGQARSGNRVAARQTPWHEYQANRAIGALLLPQALVRRAAGSYLLSDGLFGEVRLPEAARPKLIEDLIEIFDVNRPVAKIRIDQLYPAERQEQTTL